MIVLIDDRSGKPISHDRICKRFFIYSISGIVVLTGPNITNKSHFRISPDAFPTFPYSRLPPPTLWNFFDELIFRNGISLLISQHCGKCRIFTRKGIFLNIRMTVVARRIIISIRERNDASKKRERQENFLHEIVKNDNGPKLRKNPRNATRKMKFFPALSRNFPKIFPGIYKKEPITKLFFILYQCRITTRNGSATENRTPVYGMKTRCPNH